MRLRVSNEWLREKIASDPDVECEAGPSLIDIGYREPEEEPMPYEETLDDMEHEAKFKDHPVHEKMRLFAEALVTLKHARVFISTREKMHPTGIELYDDLIRRMEAFTNPE